MKQNPDLSEFFLAASVITKQTEQAFCNTCNNAIPDPAEEWPDNNGAVICQECWETQCSREWWAMVISLDKSDALGASGTAEWEGQP
jgi:hypothetical protein